MQTISVADYLNLTGTLVLGSRSHRLRPDLSGRTVCGRYSFNALPADRLNRLIPAVSPPCRMCHDPGAAQQRAEARRLSPAV